MYNRTQVSLWTAVQMKGAYKCKIKLQVPSKPMIVTVQSMFRIQFLVLLTESNHKVDLCDGGWSRVSTSSWTELTSFSWEATCTWVSSGTLKAIGQLALSPTKIHKNTSGNKKKKIDTYSLHRKYIHYRSCTEQSTWAAPKSLCPY